MVAYTKPHQRKKEESEKQRGKRDQIKFIDLRFERWQVVGFRAGRKEQDVGGSDGDTKGHQLGRKSKQLTN